MPPSYGTTARYALRKLLGTNLISDIDAGIGALADDVDGKFAGYSEGPLSSRPTSTPGSPGVAGRLYRATDFDPDRIYQDNGQGWDELTLGGTLEIPQLVTAVNMVPLMFIGTRAESIIVGSGATNGHGANKQAAALVWIPRRITGATRIRWRYRQDAGTAWSGNYALALFSAAGVKVIDTGSVAATGAVGTYQARSETITATTFEPGMYYAFFGATVSAGLASFRGALLGGASDQAPSPAMPNVGLRATAGGVTVPANLSGLTDVVGLTIDSSQGVPQMALSVG